MRPSFFIFNAAYGASLNAIINSYFALKTIVFSNFINLLLCQFCRAAAFAAICCSMFDFVCMIVFRRIPTKIFKTIVGYIAIIMTPFFFVGARTNKSHKNQSVNSKHFWFVLLPKKNKRARVIFQNGRFFQPFSFYIPYPTNVRNFIYSGISGYWHPMFHIQQSGTFNIGAQA